MAKIFMGRGRRTRLENNSRKLKASLFALVAFLGLGAVVATFAATLENDVRVDVNAELKYFLTVKEDGVDATGKESSDSTRAQIHSGRIEVTDKIPDGLVFQSFVKTSDGTIGAVSRGNKSVACAGKVIDDTSTDGVWNSSKTEFTYHGLHYNKNTGIVSFAAEKVQAGCELTVGIIVKTPETVDDPTTSQIETRRDFFNTAYASEKDLTATSNTVHVYIGDSLATLNNVTYRYSGTVPANAPVAPSAQKYSKGVKVAVNSNPALEGYTFSGWTTSNVTVNDGSFTMPASNVELVGNWTKNSTPTMHKVTYVIDGEKPEDYMPPKAKNYAVGNSVDLDATEKNTVIDGYKFLGWTTTDLTLSGNSFEMPNKDVTIHGSFERIGYMVCYEFMNQPQPANAASLVPACEKHYPGEKVSLAANPTATGFKFTGWYAKDGFTMPEKDVLIQGEWNVEAGKFAPQISKTIVDKKEKYYYGDTVKFKITVKNTASYAIKDVFIEEQLDGAFFTEGSGYTVKGGKIAVISNIPAGQSADVYASYKITENKTATLTNIVGLTSAIADGNNHFDDSKEYKASADFNTIPEPVTPTGIVMNSLPYVGIAILAAGTIALFVFISKQGKIVAFFANAKRFIVKNKLGAAISSLAIVSVILGGIVAKTVSAATYTEVIKSVNLASQNTSFANNTPGSWNIENSAKWTGAGTARITFKVNTIAKVADGHNVDIVMVLDNSGSMSGDKLNRVKSDSAALIESILSDSNNRIGLVNFNSGATKLSNLTNNKQMLLNAINNLTDEGCTNYYSGFVKAEEILEGYQKQENRELILLFLTDGYPNEETPNEIAEYKALKAMYPYMTVNGIQYEMGSNVLDPIIAISDNQFVADMSTLNNVLFEASIAPFVYEDFVITDYINNTYWNVESVDSIEATVGNASLASENGTPKVTWDMSGMLISGRSAELTIDVKLKNPGSITENTFLPTNVKETVITSLEGTPSENITSEKTPVLKSKVNVTYEPNLPKSCSSYSGALPGKKAYLSLSMIEVSDQKISCNGYIFNGWRIAEGDYNFINEDYFRALDDVTLGATWTKVSISKSMDGEVKEEVAATLDTGININAALKKLSGQPNASYNTQNTSITAIESASSMTPVQQASAMIISNSTSKIPVYAWYDSGTIYIYSDADRIVANSDSLNAFYYMSGLASVAGLADWDTSSVKEMGGMFDGDSSLTSLQPLENWDTSKVTGMTGMFRDNSSLASLAGLEKWDVSSVRSMGSMFQGDSKLVSTTALKNWNTSSVTGMGFMFTGNSSLASLSGLENWNTSSVTTMSYMFRGDSSLTSLQPLENWDTSKVTNMSDMFSGNSSLASLSGLENWNTSKVTNMSYMFGSNSKLTSLTPLANWNTSSVTNMRNMFYNNSSLTSLQPLEKWNTSKVTDMSYMFYGDSSHTSLQPLENWDTSKVTNMNRMFYDNRLFTSLQPLENWDTSSVTNMSGMFGSDTKLASLTPLANWNTSSVTNMSYMFSDNFSLTSLTGLENWDTSKVTNMSYMFRINSKLTSLQPLEKWNTSSVTDMSYMFYGDSSSSLTSLTGLEKWNTSSVTNMSYMFRNNSKLTSLQPLEKWDTSKVTNMSYMFYDDSSLTSLVSLENWNTSSVTNMSYMFYYNSSLTSLTGLKYWNASSVTNMSYMFYGDSSLTSLADLEKWNTSKVTNMSSMFTYVPAAVDRPSWYH